VCPSPLPLLRSPPLPSLSLPPFPSRSFSSVSSAPSPPPLTMSCPNCTRSGDALPAQAQTGTEQKIADLDVYVTGNGEKAIIIITDIFGWRFANMRGVADQYAAGGFTVYIPSVINDGEDAHPDRIADWRADMQNWLQRNSTARAGERGVALAKAVADKHKRIAIIGFCYGAKGAIEAFKTEHLHACVLYHPTFFTLEDIPQLANKGPMLFQCAETDQAFDHLRKDFEEGLGKQADVKFNTYPGTTHGYASRPEGDNEKKQKDIAHNEAIQWLKANL